MQYISEKQVHGGELPVGCDGSPLEPVAEPGYLCAFRNGNEGSEEASDTNAGFKRFENTNAESNESGEAGEFLLFRTLEFKEPAILIKKPAHLTAEGSWAVSAP